MADHMKVGAGGQTTKMKILTWNVNGIRASKVSLKSLLDSLDADIICLQETKVTRDMLDEPTAIVDGYNSYFSFSKVRSGYSGVATFCKESATPCCAEEGLSGLLTPEDATGVVEHYGSQVEFSDEELQALDNEGRCVITQHKTRCNGKESLLTVINVYCPRADPEREERKLFKLRFYQLLQIRAEAIMKSGSHVIILGDVNTSHRPIDHCDPVNDEEFRSQPGRQWLDQLLWEPNKDNSNAIQEQDSQLRNKDGNLTDHNTSLQSCDGDKGNDGHKFIDTFRYYHPEEKYAFTCWNTMKGCRATNYGTRIDYIFADVDLVEESFSDCIILPEVQGSDHCPVKCTMKCDAIPSKKCPPMCSKFLPEFSGKQQKLSMFFKQVNKKELTNSQASSGSDDPLSQGSGSSQGETSGGSQGQEKTTDVNKTTKRPGPLLQKQISKKAKLEKKGSGGKQGNLMSFFSKKVESSTKPKTTVSKSQNHTSNENHLNKDPKRSVKSERSAEKDGDPSIKDKNSQNIGNEDLEKADQSCKGNEIPSSGSKNSKQPNALWKSIFKGPPPPPNCKGHNEPCVLRTVKKDSLNKGRQFWVCAKPEGLKSNPLSRCDFFAWVEKNKTKK